VQAATRLLALEPLREDIHRVLMMSYASQGRFTLALKQYELCRDALQRELDVQPEPVTQSLYENLRVRRVKAGKSSVDTQDPTSSRTARLLEMQSAMRRQLELAPAFSDVPVLPDRPSVAIMPFDCELDNADQKYFAGGLTEDITTGLTKFHELFVIDTRSSQAVRELTVDMREIGRKLGVAHIVVGSVRKADDRVRVTAQLIQTAASQQIWAEKYDVALNDIFAVHDDITERIVRTLAGRIEQETRQRVAGKAMQDMAGYDLLLKAREHVHNRIREDQLAARSYLDRAISLNPKFAPAIACYALSYVYEYESPWCQNRRRAIDEAYRLGLEAVALNGNDSCAHRALAWAAFYSDRIDLAKAECELAVNLNRYELRNLCVRSWVAACEGKPAEAMTDMRDELRLSPIFPDPAYLKLGFAEMTAALYQEATESFARMSTWDQLRLAFMAICHARLGQPDKARQYTAKLQDLAAVEFAGEADPLRAWRDYMLAIVRYQHPDDQARFCEGLHKAGLPA